MVEVLLQRNVNLGMSLQEDSAKASAKDHAIFFVVSRM